MAAHTVGILFVVSLICCAVFAIPKPEDKRNQLGKDEHHSNHLNIDHHDNQYDHEAFLGDDEAKTFDELDPEESKRRLGLIVDKIDGNKDGLVTIAELKAWIQYTQRRYIEDDVQRVWKQHNPENNETVHWDVYRKNVYGFMDEMGQEEIERDDNGISYKSMLGRDRRRWASADVNLDDALSKEEFLAFLHPEDHPKMKETVLTETIEDIDKDKDGRISVEEYIGDMYKSSEPDEEEPQWVSNEREVFEKYRDQNVDGYMDRDEVRDWITPKDFDHAEAEAKHLVFEADQDSDEKLTKEEILDKYDLFVGSQATDFGEALARHDEF